MSTSPAIIHQGLLRPKGQFRANHPLLHLVIRDVVVATAAAYALPSQDTNPKICSSRPAASSRARSAHSLAGWPPPPSTSSSWISCLTHDRTTHDPPADHIGQAADNIFPPIGVFRRGFGCPFCTALGSPSGWSRTTRQVSLTSTLLSCIQSFSRPFDRSFVERGWRKGEDCSQVHRLLGWRSRWDTGGDCCCTDWRWQPSAWVEWGGCILRGWWIREREDRVFDLRTAVFFWLSSGLSLSPGDGNGGRSGCP